MIMLTLYQFRTSSLCAKVRKILDFKGLDYRTVEVDYLDRAELIDASGQPLVPGLTLESGETVADSDRIAAELETRYPVPAIFPRGWRGVHVALARYFDTELAAATTRAALPALIGAYANQGADHVAAFRLSLDRRYGDGFCDAALRDRAAAEARAHDLLAPLDETLAERAFLLGRIGYADFALYGQLFRLSLSDESKILADLTNLRAYFDRLDRISAQLDPVS